MTNPNVYYELENCYKLKIFCKDRYVYTYFDKKYYDNVCKYQWYVKYDGKRNVTHHRPYVYSGANRLQLPHLIMNFTPDGIHIIDHIDGDSLNNRCNNLRIVYKSHNQWNRRRNANKIGITGVYRCNTHNKYVAQCKCNKKSIRSYLDSFNEAVYIRILYEIYFFGDMRHTCDDEYKMQLINELSESRKLELQKRVNKQIGK